MLSTEEFKAFSTEYVMFCHVTTHIEGRKYDDLLGKKGGGGWPHLVELNKDGDVIAAVSGTRDVAAFRAMMADGAAFETLKAKADKTPDEAFDVLKKDVAWGNVGPDAAKARLAKVEGLTAEQRTELDRGILSLEIQAALPRTQDPAEAAAAKLVAGKKFAEWFAAGREPTDDQAFQVYFIYMLDHAEAVGDAALFERALGKLKAKYGSNPRAAGFFKTQDERLGKLKPGDDGDDDGEGADDEDDDDGEGMDD